LSEERESKIGGRKLFRRLNTPGRGGPDIVRWHQTLSSRSGKCPQNLEREDFQVILKLRYGLP
jgi:hypothetical protein